MMKLFQRKKKSEINALRNEVQCLRNEVRLIGERQNVICTGYEIRPPFGGIYTSTETIINLILAHLGLEFKAVKAVPEYVKLAQAAINPLPDEPKMEDVSDD